MLSRKFAVLLTVLPIAFAAGSLLHPARLIAVSIGLLLLAAGTWLSKIKTAQADADAVILGKVHPDDRPRYRREFIKALKGEAPMEIEYRVKEHDGNGKWIGSL